MSDTPFKDAFEAAGEKAKVYQWEWANNEITRLKAENTRLAEALKYARMALCDLHSNCKCVSQERHIPEHLLGNEMCSECNPMINLKIAHIDNALASLVEKNTAKDLNNEL